tara:strand:+ start:322 stop:816 length:495 start_codon:yes stop_codon:yes gene_type:complete
MIILKNKVIILLFLKILLSYSEYDNSNFPGGYINLGINIGKTNDNTIFRDVQITSGLVLFGPYHNEKMPGYIFGGVTIGKRFYKDKTALYYDLQINFWGVLGSIGFGKGYINIDNQKYNRTKTWFSLMPIARTYDNYILDNQKIKHKGYMGVIPFPFFGKYFYP